MRSDGAWCLIIILLLSSNVPSPFQRSAWGLGYAVMDNHRALSMPTTAQVLHIKVFSLRLPNLSALQMTLEELGW